MSKRNKTSLKKFVALATMFTTVLWMCSVAMLVPNTASAISEGDLIRGPDGIKVYIVNSNGYRRHIYNPEVFNMYGHFTWASIQDVSQSVIDSYTVSDLYRADGDTRVYSVGEDGIKHWLNMTAEEFVTEGYSWNQVFIVNSTESNYYTVGSELTPAGSTPVTPVTGSGLTVSLASDTPVAGIAVENAARMPFTKVNLTASSEANVVIDSLTVERTGLSNDSNFSSIVLVDVATDELIGTSKTLGALHTCVFNDDITVLAGTTKSIYLAANMYSTLQAGETGALSLKEVVAKSGATVNGTLPVTGNTQSMNGTLAIGTLTISAGGLNPSAATKKVGETDYTFASLNFGTIANENVILDKITFNQEGTAADTDVANLELVNNGTVVATGTLSGKKVTFDLNPDVTITKGTTKEYSLRGDIAGGSSRTIDFDIKETAYLKVKGATYGYNITATFPNASDPYFNGAITTISTGSLTVSKGTVSSTNVTYGTTGQTLAKFQFNAQGEDVSVTRMVFNVTISASAATVADLTNITVYDDSGNLVAGPVDITDNTGPDQATTTDTVIFPIGIKNYTVKGDLNQDWAAGDTIALSINTPDAKFTAKGVTTANTITVGPASTVTGDTITVKAGALTISTLPTPAAQNVIISAQDYLFSKFLFDASASGEDINVTSIAIKHTTSAASLHTNITGITLYDTSIASEAACIAVSGRTWDAALSECALNTPAQGTASAHDSYGSTATTTVTLSSGILKIVKGASKTVYLRADITSGTAADTHSFGLQSDSVTATGADTGATITESVNPSDGQAATLQSAGKFTATKDSSSPANKLIASGTTGETISVLNVTSEWENVKITTIQLNADAANSGTVANSTAALRLYEEGNSTAVATTYATSTVVVFEIPAGTTLTIPTGASGKKLTVKADIANIGDGYTGQSGKGFQLDLDAATDIDATGSVSSSAATVNGSAITDLASVYVYKSLPTVTIESPASTTLTNGTGIELFRFKLTANSAGDIGYYKASFAINTSTATVTSFELYEYDTAGNESNLTYNAARDVDQIYIASSDGKNGQYVINVLFDTDTEGVGGGGEFRTIPAGSYRTYKLKATVANSAAGSSISTSLMGDRSASAATYPGAAGDGIDGSELDGFIWSDLWYSATGTATRTDEWTNGYLVSGLVATSAATSLSR